MNNTFKKLIVMGWLCLTILIPAKLFGQEYNPGGILKYPEVYLKRYGGGDATEWINSNSDLPGDLLADHRVGTSSSYNSYDINGNGAHVMEGTTYPLRGHKHSYFLAMYDENTSTEAKGFFFIVGSNSDQVVSFERINYDESIDIIIKAYDGDGNVEASVTRTIEEPDGEFNGPVRFDLEVVNVGASEHLAITNFVVGAELVSDINLDISALDDFDPDRFGVGSYWVQSHTGSNVTFDELMLYVDHDLTQHERTMVDNHIDGNHKGWNSNFVIDPNLFHEGNKHIYHMGGIIGGGSDPLLETAQRWISMEPHVNPGAGVSLLYGFEGHTGHVPSGLNNLHSIIAKVDLRGATQMEVDLGVLLSNSWIDSWNPPSGTVINLVVADNKSLDNASGNRVMIPIATSKIDVEVKNIVLRHGDYLGLVALPFESCWAGPKDEIVLSDYVTVGQGSGPIKFALRNPGQDKYITISNNLYENNLSPVNFIPTVDGDEFHVPGWLRSEGTWCLTNENGTTRSLDLRVRTNDFDHIPTSYDQYAVAIESPKSCCPIAIYDLEQYKGNMENGWLTLFGLPVAPGQWKMTLFRKEELIDYSSNSWPVYTTQTFVRDRYNYGAGNFQQDHLAFVNSTVNDNPSSRNILIEAGTREDGTKVYGVGCQGSGHDISNGCNNYGAVHKGYLYVPETGVYNFGMSVDDQAEFFLDLNDGNGLVSRHFQGSSTGFSDYEPGLGLSYTLNANEYYEFAVYHQEKSGWDWFYLGWNLVNPSGYDVPGAYFSQSKRNHPAGQLFKLENREVITATAGVAEIQYPDFDNVDEMSLTLSVDRGALQYGDVMRFVHNGANFETFKEVPGVTAYKALDRQWHVDYETSNASSIPVDFGFASSDFPTDPSTNSFIVIVSDDKEMTSNVQVYGLNADWTKDDIPISGSCWVSIGVMNPECGTDPIGLAEIGFAADQPPFNSKASDILTVAHDAAHTGHFQLKESLTISYENGSTYDYAGGAGDLARDFLNVLVSDRKWCLQSTASGQRLVEFALDKTAMDNTQIAIDHAKPVLVLSQTGIFDASSKVIGLSDDEGVYRSGKISIGASDQVALGYLNYFPEDLDATNNDLAHLGKGWRNLNDTRESSGILTIDQPVGMEENDHLLVDLIGSGGSDYELTEATGMTGITPRSESVWQVKEYNDIESVHVSFDVTGVSLPSLASDEYFVLLISTDQTDFSSAQSIRLYEVNEGGKNMLQAFDVALDNGDFLALAKGVESITATNSTCMLTAPQAGNTCPIVLDDHDHFDPNTHGPCHVVTDDAKIQMVMDMGEDYELGNTPWDASVNADLAIKALDGTTVLKTVTGVVMTTAEDRPEVTYQLDVTDLYEQIGSIEVAVTSVTSSSDPSIANLSEKIRLTSEVVTKERTWVHQTTYPVLAAQSALPKSSTEAEYIFTWDNQYCEAPEYQFQLVKIFNTNESNTTYADVDGVINWDEALTMEVPSNQVTLTMVEGSGYYAWRIRPIGNYFKGGVASNENWGAWSSSLNQDQSVAYSNRSSVPDQVVYVEQFDNDKNFIYGRTFTEGGRVSESITYANGLNQSKQSMTHLSSSEGAQIVVNQSVYDYAGRAAIQTLPAAVSDHNNELSFRENFMLNSDGTLYRDEDFDSDDIYKNENLEIALEGGLLHDYYDSDHPDHDKRVADGEGFPFNRVLYSNDGTGRAVETGNVGRTLAIGQGHTTRVKYSKATDAELIRVFGDEAPDASEVIKVITQDPNNITSVRYQTVTGVTIATALMVDDDPTNLIPLTSETDLTLELKDRPELSEAQAIRDMLLNGTTTYGVEHVSFTEGGQSMTINYDVTPGIVSQQCGEICAQCSYDLTITVQDMSREVGEPTLIYSYSEIIPGSAIDASGACTTPALIERDVVVSQDEYIDGHRDGEPLNDGTGYLVTKKLSLSYAGKETFVEEAVAEVKAEVETYVSSLQLALSNAADELTAGNLAEVESELQNLQASALSSDDFSISIYKINSIEGHVREGQRELIFDSEDDPLASGHIADPMDPFDSSEPFDLTLTYGPTGTSGNELEGSFIMELVTTSGCCDISIPVTIPFDNPCEESGDKGVMLTSALVDVVFPETPGASLSDVAALNNVKVGLEYNYFSTPITYEFDDSQMATVLNNMIADGHTCEDLLICARSLGFALKAEREAQENPDHDVSSVLDDLHSNPDVDMPDFASDVSFEIDVLSDLFACAGTEFIGVKDPSNSVEEDELLAHPYKYFAYRSGTSDPLINQVEASFCFVENVVITDDPFNPLTVEEHDDGYYLEKQAQSIDVCSNSPCTYSVDVDDKIERQDGYKFSNYELGLFYRALKHQQEIDLGEWAALVANSAADKVNECKDACESNYDVLLTGLQDLYKGALVLESNEWVQKYEDENGMEIPFSDLCCTAQSLVEACQAQCVFTENKFEPCEPDKLISVGTQEELDFVAAVVSGDFSLTKPAKTGGETYDVLSLEASALLDLINELIYENQELSSNTLELDTWYSIKGYETYLENEEVFHARDYHYVAISATGELSFSEDGISEDHSLNFILNGTSIDLATQLGRIGSLDFVSKEGTDQIKVNLQTYDGYQEDIVSLSSIEMSGSEYVDVIESHVIAVGEVLTDDELGQDRGFELVSTPNTLAPPKCYEGEQNHDLWGDLELEISDVYDFTGEVAILAGIEEFQNQLLVSCEVTSSSRSGSFWSQPSCGEYDLGIALIDPVSGTLSENILIGGSGVDMHLGWHNPVQVSNGKISAFGTTSTYDGSCDVPLSPYLNESAWFVELESDLSATGDLNQIYGTNYIDEGTGVVHLSDGGSILALNSLFTGGSNPGFLDGISLTGNPSSYLARIDDVGDLQWVTRLSSATGSITTHWRVVEMVEDPQSEKVYALEYYPRDGECKVSCVSFDGNIEWAYDIEQAHIVGLNHESGIERLENGNIVVAYTKGQSASSGSSDLALVCLNTFGVEQWSHVVDIQSRDEVYGLDVEDDVIYLFSHDGNTAVNQSHIRRYSVDGILLGTNKVNWSLPNTSAPLTQEIEVIDGRLYLSYMLIDLTTGINHWKVAELAPEEASCSPLSVGIRWNKPTPGALAEPENLDNDDIDRIAAEEALKDINAEINRCLYAQEEELASAYKEQCMATLYEVTSVQAAQKIHHYTLYYHDRAGHLVSTVPPAGVENVDLSLLHRDTESGVLERNAPTVSDVESKHRMITRYQYNSYGQVITSQTPDGGESKFIYDPNGMLRYSQDAQQAIDNTYSYIKYDALGRTMEVGLYQGATHSWAAVSSNPDLYMGVIGSLADTYGANSWPNDGYTDYETKTEYNQSVAGVNYQGQQQHFLRNRVSHTYTHDGVHTYYSYDVHGNVKWLVVDVPGLGRNTVAYTYDLISGNVLHVAYNDGYADQMHHKYEYDADNRVNKVMTSRDKVVWTQEADYEYYAHGPLARTVVGEDGVQGIDNTYTLQGWLKAMNNPEFDEVFLRNTGTSSFDPGRDGVVDGNARVAMDLFGEELFYFDGDFNGDWELGLTEIDTKHPWSGAGTMPLELFNGNIAAIHERTNFVTSGNAQSGVLNKYHYDHLNRLVKSSVSNWVSTNKWKGLNKAGYLTSYSYDANGNIETLKRKGRAGVTKYMDDLDYKYFGELSENGDKTTNRLNYVTDLGGIGVATTDIEDQEQYFSQYGYDYNYKYDEVGNIIEDRAEKLEMTWTPYGKVAQVQKYADQSLTGSPVESIDFVYDASGNRVSKAVTDAASGNTTTTYYARDASGNPMSIYRKTHGGYMFQDEIPVYGAARLGGIEDLVSIPKSSSLFGRNDLIFKEIAFSSPLGTTVGLGSYIMISNNSGFDLDLNDVHFEYETNHTGGNVSAEQKLELNLGLHVATLKANESIILLYDGQGPGVTAELDIYTPQWGTTNKEILANLYGWSSAQLVDERIHWVEYGDDDWEKGGHYFKNGAQHEKTFKIRYGSDLYINRYKIGSNSNNASINSPAFTESDPMIRNQNGVLLRRNLIDAYSDNAEDGDFSKGAYSDWEWTPNYDHYSRAEGDFASRYVDLHVYEMNDHLGNVRSTYGDVKIPQEVFVDWQTESMESLTEEEGGRTSLHHDGTKSLVISGGNVESPVFSFDIENDQEIAALRLGFWAFNSYVNNPIGHIGDIEVTFFDNGVALTTTPEVLPFGGTYAWRYKQVLPQLPTVSYDEVQVKFMRFGSNKFWVDELNLRLDYTTPTGQIVFTPNKKSHVDYYPFGMEMPNRAHSSVNNRYGFNGMEKETGIGNNGDYYTSHYRMNDVRIGRWQSIDPKKFPWESSYTSMGNNPANLVDPNGDVVSLGWLRGGNRNQFLNSLRGFTGLNVYINPLEYSGATIELRHPVLAKITTFFILNETKQVARRVLIHAIESGRTYSASSDYMFMDVENEDMTNYKWKKEDKYARAFLSDVAKGEYGRIDPGLENSFLKHPMGRKGRKGLKKWEEEQGVRDYLVEVLYGRSITTGKEEWMAAWLKEYGVEEPEIPLLEPERDMLSPEWNRWYVQSLRKYDWLKEMREQNSGKKIKVPTRPKRRVRRGKYKSPSFRR